MIKLELDRHDFLYAVEGFARGSHLRQHVWQEIVYRSIPQMSEDDLDFLWFYMRRDIFERYFYELNGKKNTHFGYEDFMHALAALHRGNRYKVVFYSETDKRLHQAICYRFDGEYRPLYAYSINMKLEKKLESFNSFIPQNSVWTAKRQELPKNKYVELGREEWWNDLEIYDNFKTKLL